MGSEKIGLLSFELPRCEIPQTDQPIIYLPLDPHTWYPVVLRQTAVNEEVVVVVTVVVVVEVPKYSKTRP